MQVQRIDRIELGRVDEVDPDRPRALDQDRLLPISEGDRVDGIEFVLFVEIGVEPVHHHDEFLPARMLGRAVAPAQSSVSMLWMPVGVRVDDQRAIEALMDVAFQRHGVAVVQVTAERPGVDLVREGLAGFDQASACDSVHARGVN